MQMPTPPPHPDTDSGRCCSPSLWTKSLRLGGEGASPRQPAKRHNRDSKQDFLATNPTCPFYFLLTGETLPPVTPQTPSSRDTTAGAGAGGRRDGLQRAPPLCSGSEPWVLKGERPGQALGRRGPAVKWVGLGVVSPLLKPRGPAAERAL